MRRTNDRNRGRTVYETKIIILKKEGLTMDDNRQEVEIDSLCGWCWSAVPSAESEPEKEKESENK